MAKLNINFSDLSDTIESTKSASKCLDACRELLKNNAKNKIDNLSGKSCGYTESASSYTSDKMKVLENKSERLSKFATKLSTFHQNAKDTDSDLASTFKTCAEYYKDKNDLNSNIVVEFLTRVSTELFNSSEFGRFLSSMLEANKIIFEDLKDFFGNWYKQEGGKYAVAIGLAALAVGLAVVTIVTAGTGILAALAVIGAVIAIANAVTTICTSLYASGQNADDPAWANRYGKMNKLSTYLKKQFAGSKIATGFANVLDVTETICTVASLASLGKDGYKFLTKGDRGTLLKLNFRDSSTGKYTMKSIGNGLKSLKTNSTLRNRALPSLKEIGSGFGNYATDNFTGKMKSSVTFDGKVKASFWKVLKEDKSLQLGSKTTNTFKVIKTLGSTKTIVDRGIGIYNKDIAKIDPNVNKIINLPNSFNTVKDFSIGNFKSNINILNTIIN
jgi:hypothetical protein